MLVVLSVLSVLPDTLDIEVHMHSHPGEDVNADVDDDDDCCTEPNSNMAKARVCTNSLREFVSILFSIVLQRLFTVFTCERPFGRVIPP